MRLNLSHNQKCGMAKPHDDIDLSYNNIKRAEALHSTLGNCKLWTGNRTASTRDDGSS